MTVRSVMLFVLMAFVAVSAAADVLSLGSASVEPMSTVVIPMYLRDLSGSPLGTGAGSENAIQGIAFKVLADPPAAISSISFARAGKLAAPIARYERSVPVLGGVGYIVSFPSSQPLDFTPDATAPGDLIGNLTVSLSASLAAGRTVTLRIDPNTTALSNDLATRFETPYGSLQTVSGSIEAIGDPTTVVLGTTPNPSIARDPLQLTAMVSSPISGAITGTVTFFSGPDAIGTAPLQSGSAQLTVSDLAAGVYSLTARYDGDLIYESTVSNAVEQTVNIRPFGPPQNLQARATSGTRVLITWTRTDQVGRHEILRDHGQGQHWIANVDGTASSYVDLTVQPGRAYVYSVRAYGSNSIRESDSDVAVTIIFEDDPLVPGMPMKLTHLTQLRQAVNLIRGLSNSAAYPFTDPAPVSGTPVRPAHVLELRDALNEGRTRRGMPPVVFIGTGVASGSPVRAAHFQELRNAAN